MPRKSGYEVRGEFLALQLFDKVGKAVSPSDINAHVGRGDYAAKYISFLRSRHGFNFSVQRDNRNVVSYTLESEPKNAAEVRAKATAVKSPKAKPAKAAKVSSKSAMTQEEIKKAAADFQELRKSKSGVTPTSFSVDPDWDAVDNIRDLV